IVSTVAAGPDAVANNSLSPIHFDAGTTQIRPSMRRSWMAWLGRKLAQCLRIEGYADSVGDREPVGSGPRAANAYLVSRGVPAERITASAGGGVPSRMHPVLAVGSTRPRQAIEQERLPAFCAVTGIEATECPWSRPAHYRFRTTSSRRRFFARPCSVSFCATGFSCPYPAEVMRDAGMPPLTMSSFTATARSTESVLLAMGSPVLSVCPSRATDTEGYALRTATKEFTVALDSVVSPVEPVSKLRSSKRKRFGTLVSVVLASQLATLKLKEPSGTEILTPSGSWSSLSFRTASVTREAAPAGLDPMAEVSDVNPDHPSRELRPGGIMPARTVFCPPIRLAREAAPGAIDARCLPSTCRTSGAARASSDDADSERTPAKRAMRSPTLLIFGPNSESRMPLPAPSAVWVVTPPPNRLVTLSRTLPSYLPSSSMRTSCWAPWFVD